MFLGPSREFAQGDLTMPCFPFAKILKKAPNQVADEIADTLSAKISIADVISTNGYVNFKASAQWLATNVIEGRITVNSATENSTEGKKVLIEHTSANPNGPFHVGRGREMRF